MFRKAAPVTSVSLRTLRFKIFSLSAASFTNGTATAETKYKKLFTPGPLSVSSTTKIAMLEDVGSRDPEFMEIIKEARSGVISLAETNPERYTCVFMQGSGTFCTESVLQTSIPRNGGHIVVFSNGDYAKRMEALCEKFNANCTLYTFPSTDKLPLDGVEKALQELSTPVTNVAITHCETSCGVINNAKSIGELVKRYIPSATFIVDAMSSFGGVPIDLAGSNIDFLVTSPNKCIEGIPGFGLVIADKKKLLDCEGNSRSMSLDLTEQYKGLEETGQFRFTPPTHVLLGFRQALIELRKEGGIKARAARYRANRDIVCAGLKKMGFEMILKGDHPESYIVTTFRAPTHPNYIFKEFYNRLSRRGCCIYHGQMSVSMETFRIGHIGQIFPDDCNMLLQAVEEVCHEMNLPLPLRY